MDHTDRYGSCDGCDVTIQWNNVCDVYESPSSNTEYQCLSLSAFSGIYTPSVEEMCDRCFIESMYWRVTWMRKEP